MANGTTFQRRSAELFSNEGARGGGQQDAIDRLAAGIHGRIHEVSGVIMDARPRPVLRTADQARLHRVQVKILHLFVIFPHGPQGAIKKAWLEERSSAGKGSAELFGSEPNYSAVLSQ